MQFEGRYKLEAPPEQVWLLLTEPAHLMKALPGCERVEEQARGQYEALLKIGIAAFKGTYRFRFDLTDPRYPCSYRLVGKGGGNRGIVTGEAFVTLVRRDGHTLVSFHATTELGGGLSNVGARMLKRIAKMLLNQFFKKLQGELL